MHRTIPSRNRALITALALIGCGSASAVSTASVPLDAAFGVRLASDYNFRGISQTDRGLGPNDYAEFQFNDNFFYAGVAAYRVKLPNDPSAEIDIFAGIRPKLGDVAFDLGLIHYAYPSGTAFRDGGGALLVPANIGFTEVAARATYTASDRLSIGAGVFHSGDWLATDARGTYINVPFRLTFPSAREGAGSFALSGELGHYGFGTTNAELGSVALPDYRYVNLGAAYTTGPWTFDVRYHHTDLDRSQCFALTGDPAGLGNGGRSDWCGNALVGTISLDFTARGLGWF